MSEANTYPPNPRSKVNRLGKRGVYDYETIHSIISTSPIVHVSFQPRPAEEDPFPTILPMLCSAGSFADQAAPLSSGPLDLYLHGYVSNRMMRLSTSSETDGDGEGLPVCIAASHVDGIVLSLTPFHNSMNYRSAVIHGYCAPVTDAAEKLYAMRLMTDEIVPGRWAGSRVPPTKAEMQGTSILRVKIVSASAKVRVGGPSEDRNDERDVEGVRGKVWTGVVPLSARLGAPVPAPGNVVAEVPQYVSEWVRASNEDGERRAREAVAGSSQAK